MKTMSVLYLLTGAAGNLGSSIIKKLIKMKENVRAFVFPNDQTAKRIPRGAEIVKGEILNKDDVKRFFTKKKDEELIVIHCAGIVTTFWKFVKHSKYNLLLKESLLSENVKKGYIFNV
jgi:dihydroflavonol-4-reductase